VWKSSIWGRTVSPTEATLFPERKSRVIAGIFAGAVSLYLFFHPPLFSEEPNAMFFFREGSASLQRKDYRAAVHNFRIALEKNPRFARASLGLAQAYFELGDNARAEENFRLTLTLERESKEAMTGLARVLSSTSRYDEALELLRKAAATDPGGAEINFAFGELYQKWGKNNLAVSYYEKVLRASPSHIPSLLGLAELYAQSGRYDMAERYVSQASRIDSVRPEIHLARGRIRLGMALASTDDAERIGFLDSAYGSFRTCLELSPQNYEAQKRMIWISLYRNRANESLGLVRDLLTRDPANPEMNYMMGSLIRILARNPGQLRSSIQYLAKTVELTPADSLARFSLEDVALELASDSTLASQRRNLADYHFTRYRFYASQNRPDQMNAHLKRVLQLRPDFLPAVSEQLEYERRAGNYEKFMYLLSVMRRMNPDNVRIRNRLEEALREKNQSLAYRENLLSPEVFGEDGTYRRTPTMVYIFDFRPEDPFPYHPDAPERLASALAFQLRGAGRIRAVDDELRRKVQTAIRSSMGSRDFYSYGVYFSPENLSFLEEHENDDLRIDYIVHGSFRARNGGYQVSYEITEKGSGRRIDRFSIDGEGRDAMQEIAIRAARRLSNLPFYGRVVKLRSGNVFINLGKIDGIEKDAVFNVMRNRSSTGTIKVLESSTYISRCAVTDSDFDRLNVGDTVILRR